MAVKIAAALAGLGTAATIVTVVVTDRPTTAPHASEPLYPAFRVADVSGLYIRDGGDEVRLARAGDAWRLHHPVEDAAATQGVTEALRALARLELDSEPVARGKDAWPRYEVADDEVITAVVSEDGAALPPLHVGRSGFARVGDDEDVYEVPGFLRELLDRDLTDWRDLAILDLGDEPITAVEAIDAEGRRARADRGPGTETADVREIPRQAWVLTAGEEHASPFDPAVPASLVRYVGNLRGQDVAEPTSAAKALADPTLRIRLYGHSGLRELTLGDRHDGMTALALAGSDRIWLLSHAQAKELAQGPVQWRNKDILDVRPTDITALEVQRHDRQVRVERDDSWRLSKPHAASLSAGAAEAFARDLSPLAADAIADHNARMPDDAGRIHIELRNGDEVTVRIGERDDGTFLVASSERDDTLVLEHQRAKALFADAFAIAASAEP